VVLDSQMLRIAGVNLMGNAVLLVDAGTPSPGRRRALPTSLRILYVSSVSAKA